MGQSLASHPNTRKQLSRGSTIRDTTESSGSADTQEQTQTDDETETPSDDAKPKYAKESIDLDKAIQKKKAGHFLKCADCG
ncbi:MAG: hypothetical protein SVU32_07895, partial [Candidatus Nanohaloarchaea archaeon]|nr:hypothetical protein [Candidatus Nanohaloarchaea archaeon]